MGEGKNKAHRKKRISKHVLQAQERKRKEEETEDQGDAGATGAESNNTETPQQKSTAVGSPTKKTKSKKNTHVKDPTEVQNYLSAWKHRESAPGVWKFNKNTQSWLFRHMYDVELIQKATFSLLMEYLGGLKGATRERVNGDAIDKAMRYKTWEKNKGENEGESAAGAGSESEKKNAEKKDDEKKDAEMDGEQRFHALNDHDKRREYKRARKVLDTLKTSETKESS